MRIARDRNYQRILCEFDKVTRNNRLTVEELATDCIDVRELYKAGALDAECQRNSGQRNVTQAVPLVARTDNAAMAERRRNYIGSKKLEFAEEQPD